MRRVAFREGMVIGAVAASRPRPVVYAAPVAYMPPPVVYASQPPTQVIVESAPPPMPQPYPPASAYPPASYPPNPYPPAGYPPASYSQPSYPPTPVYAQAPAPAPYYPEPSYAPPPTAVYQPPAPTVTYVATAPAAPAPVVVEVARPPVVTPAGVAAVAVGAAVAVAAVEERKHFYLINEATCTVLGVEKNSLKPGAYLALEKRRPDKSYAQIWYLDHDGVIRSKLTDFALECKRRDERVHLVPYTGDARQQWVLDGNRILNKIMRNDCLGLHKLLRLKDDADVIAQQYEGKPYQHWRMDPVVI